MKKNITLQIYIMLVILFVTIENVLGQYSYEYDPVTIKTPRNVSVDALEFKDDIYDDFTAPEAAFEDAEWTDNFNVDILESSTKYYNCHGYAWHNIDGGNTVWINDVNQYGNPIYNVTKYYSGTNATYSQTSNNRAGLKVSYFPRDHSAVTTSDPNYFISKWAWGPLVKHQPEQCPFYQNANIKYYQVPLNGEDIACVPDNESYTTLNISGASYNWSGNRISISGSSHSVSVSGTSNGQGYIDVDISSPHSGTTVTTRKKLWVGKADYTVLGASVDGFQAGQEELSNCDLTYAEAEYNNPPYTSSISGYTGRSGITEYDWDIPYSSDWYIDEEYGSPVDWQYVEIDYYDANPPSEETIRIRAYNTCGWSYWKEVEWEVDDCASPFFSVALSPNPSQSLLTISFEKNHQPSGVNEKTPMPEIPVEVALYNGQQSKILHTKGFTSNSIKVNTSNIPAGSYIIHVNIEGEQPLKKHLMIE